MFLRKVILRISSKFTGEHPCQNAISINLQSNFIEITLWNGCSPVNLLHVLRTPFPKNTSGRLLLNPVHRPLAFSVHSKRQGYLRGIQGYLFKSMSNIYDRES